MPTETFVRLPKEKQKRFMDAAWAEFTRAPFAETSINRIVRQAEIPRGSFYQYFTDKEELFTYLLEGVRDYLTESYAALLRSLHGDLFRTQLRAFDMAVNEGLEKDPFLERYAKLLRINPAIDLQKMLRGGDGDGLVEKMCAEMDTSGFADRSGPAVQQVFILALMALGSSVVDCLLRPDRRGDYRKELEIRLNIIQKGCLGVPALT